jgi:hypothetical protein
MSKRLVNLFAKIGRHTYVPAKATKREWFRDYQIQTVQNLGRHQYYKLETYLAMPSSMKW